MKNWMLSFLFVLLLGAMARAQNSLPPEVARNGYADMIVINGKIVSMDDTGYNTNPGTLYEAMAIKGTRIMALGATDRIRAMADSNTRVIDARGQMVMPGIVESHAHIYSSAGSEALGYKSPDKIVNITVRAGKDFETTRLRLETRVAEEVQKLEPGDWVVVGLQGNPEEGVSGQKVQAWVTADVIAPKNRMDRVAPDNPVLVRSGPRGNLNSKGFEMGDKLVPNYSKYVLQSIGDGYVDNIEKGFVGVSAMTSLSWDVWNRDMPASLAAELTRRQLEQAASHGVTTFSSRVPHPRILESFTWLDREKQMPIRFAALMEVHRRPADPQATRQFYKMLGNMTDVGSEYLWFHGVASEFWDAPYPFACLGKDVEAAPKIKERETCPKPGEMWWDTLQTALESGWRLAGIHGVGSDGVRRFIQLVEMAAKNKGMTVEDIRRLEMTVEHAQVLGTVPDVVQGLAKYNMIVSASPGYMTAQPEYIADYGPEIDKFIVPVKSLLDQGVRVVGQVHGYRGIGSSWLRFITRKLEDGTVVNAKEAVDRVVVLKMWTNWASEYVRRPEELGSLKVGKLADFLILDRDYLTIREEELPEIRPQMTVIGGKIKYLGSDFARQLGMEPVGYQFPEGYKPWGRGGFQMDF